MARERRSTSEKLEVTFSAPTRNIRIPAVALPSSPPPAVRDKCFSFASLAKYSARQRGAIHAADRLFHGLIATIGPTITWKLEGGDRLQALYEGGHHAIFCFWHEVIFCNTWFWRDRGAVVMASRSFDGEYIARFILRFGYGVARGSSTRGGVGALIRLDAALRAGYDAAFTVDGPRGPRRVAKAGPVILAKRSGHAIVPVHVSSSAYWEIPSWDRMQIPKPFSRAVVRVAPPLFVPREANEASLDETRRALQAALDDLVSQRP